MTPRPRTRSRSPPPPSGGPHHRRLRDPPPPQHHSLNPENPSLRQRRSRDEILLEAGRLAAHYLVSQGVYPEHLLRAREIAEHNNRPDPPAAGYARDWDDDDTRWRRNGGGGDWGRDRLSRRSGWDRRSQSFDGRRRYNDVGGGGAADDRRSHAYEPAMSRSYSHNDRPGGGGDDDDRRSHAYEPAMSRSYSHNDRPCGGGDDDRRSQSFDGRRRYNDVGGGGGADDDRRSHAYEPAMSRSYSHNDRPCGGGDDDRRSQSFDGRRRYNDVGGGGGDDDRRSHAYEPAMSRSYSHDDLRATSDDRRTSYVDPKRRCRSWNRSYHDGGRRDSDWRPAAGNGDFDQSKVSESGATCHVDYNGAGHATRDLKESCLLVAMEGDDDSTGYADALIKSKDHVCGHEDGEIADEINASQHQLSNVDIVHPSQPVEEPAHMQPHLCDVKGNRESDIPRLIDPAAEYNGCSQDIRYELEAPQSEIETDLTRDEQERPAWYRTFDLNVAYDGSEASESPPANSVCDYVPDLVGHTGQETYYDTSETQGQDECADDNQQLEVSQGLLNQGIGTYDLNRNDMNGEQMLLNRGVDEHGQDSHQLEDEQILLNNEERLLKQDTGAYEDHNHQMENGHKLLKQDSTVQALDNYHVAGEQFLFGHAVDEHSEDNHQIKNEQMLPHQASNGADKPNTDESQSKDAQMLLEHAAHRKPRGLGIDLMIPLTNLEDDYEEQSDTKELLEHKSDALHRDNALPEHGRPASLKFL